MNDLEALPVAEVREPQDILHDLRNEILRVREYGDTVKVLLMKINYTNFPLTREVVHCEQLRNLVLEVVDIQKSLETKKPAPLLEHGDLFTLQSWHRFKVDTDTAPEFDNTLEPPEYAVLSSVRVSGKIRLVAAQSIYNGSRIHFYQIRGDIKKCSNRKARSCNNPSINVIGKTKVRFFEA